jgi:hypothetical protein
VTCSACHKTRAAIFSALAGGEDSISMTADYTYTAARNVHIKYIAGAVYRNVPSKVAAAILAAGSGTIHA